MTGKLSTMSYWSFYNIGPVMSCDYPERCIVSPTCVAPESPGKVETLDVRARFGFAEEPMVAGHQ